MFVRALEKAIGRELRSQVIVYVDDILIISETWEEHIKILNALLTRFGEQGVTIKLKKSHFGRERVKFLGHIVDTNGIRPDPSKLEAIEKFPRPKNKKQLRSFFGMIGFYRRFIGDQILNSETLLRLSRGKVAWMCDFTST